MVKKFKALLTDVDGTLVISDPNAVPSLKVISAIKKAQLKIHVGIATSRAPYQMSRITKVLPLPGPSVIDGGARIVDLSSNKTFFIKTINSSDIKKIIQIFRKYTSNKITIDEKNRSYNYSKNEKIKNPLNIYVQQLDIETANQLQKELTKISTISALQTTSWSAGKRDLIVANAAATKLHGVFQVAKILDITPQEIIGVGDGYNDFALLEACGLKIAMGNAVDELKAVADYVAPSVKEDGLAHVIEKFVLNEN